MMRLHELTGYKSITTPVNISQCHLQTALDGLFDIAVDVVLFVRQTLPFIANQIADLVDVPRLEGYEPSLLWQRLFCVAIKIACIQRERRILSTQQPGWLDPNIL